MRETPTKYFLWWCALASSIHATDLHVLSNSVKVKQPPPPPPTPQTHTLGSFVWADMRKWGPWIQSKSVCLLSHCLLLLSPLCTHPSLPPTPPHPTKCVLLQQGHLAGTQYAEAKESCSVPHFFYRVHSIENIHRFSVVLHFLVFQMFHTTLKHTHTHTCARAHTHTHTHTHMLHMHKHPEGTWYQTSKQVPHIHTCKQDYQQFRVKL